MLVKHLASGQIGEIPDDKFDPNLFEVVQSQPQTTQPNTSPTVKAPPVSYQDQSAVQGGLGGGIWNILKGITSPVRYATGGLIQAPVAALSGGRVNTYDLPVIGGLLGLGNQELKAMAKDGSVDIDPKKVAKRYTKEAAKAVATLSTPGIKVGGAPVLNKIGLGSVSKAALPGAGFKYGAMEGAVQGLGADEVTPEGLLASTVGGGVLGKAFSMLPKASGEAAESALDARNAAYMTRSAQKGAYSGANQDAQVEIAKQYLPDLLGSPKKMQRALPKALEDINDKIELRLDKTNVIDDFFKKLKPALRENVSQMGRSERLVKYVDDMSDTIKLIKEKVGKEANEETIYNAKKYFTNVVRPIHKKLNANTALSKTEQVTLAAHKTLLDMIDTFPDSEIRKLNMDQKILNDLATSLEGSINKERIAALFGVPLFNMRGLEQATLNKFAEGQDFVSAATKPFSGVNQGIATTAGGVVGGQAGLQAVAPGSAQTSGEVSPQKQAQLEELQGLLENKQNYETERGVGEERRITNSMYSQMMLDPRLTKASKDYLTKVYNSQVQAGKAEKDPAAIQQKRAASKSAVQKINQLKNRYEEKKLARGVVGGNLAKALSVTQKDPDVTAYLSTKEAYAPTIAKALGDVGNLADKEQERALNAIPDIGDTPEVAAQKWQYLLELVTYYE